MIDWLSVVASSLLIIGLGVILAALSYYYWLAEQDGRPFREELNSPPLQTVFLAGMLLTGVSLALMSDGLWPTLAAAGLIVCCVVALISLWRFSRQHPQD
jgi:hypothetical protein